MHCTFISHPQICSVFPLSITNCVQVFQAQNTSTVLLFFFTWLPHAQPAVKFWLTLKSQVIPYVLLSLVCPSLSGPSISSPFIPHNPQYWTRMKFYPEIKLNHVPFLYNIFQWSKFPYVKIKIHYNLILISFWLCLSLRPFSCTQFNAYLPWSKHMMFQYGQSPDQLSMPNSKASASRCFPT